MSNADGSISFCIDATEVTRNQYGEFVDAGGGGADKRFQECAANLFYHPYQLDDAGPPPMLADNTPVIFIDWCDAYAYCAWAGKRLCGRIARGGLTLGQSSDPHESQWMFACSLGGSRAYPYGESYEAGICNDGTKQPRYLAGTNEFPRCGFGGVLAMSGNVEEWEDSCNHDQCYVRGGSAYDERTPDADPFSCAVPLIANRLTRDPDVGFRCCSD